MKIKYLSHSAFLLIINEYKIVIDPFIEGNPNAPGDLSNEKIDYIILSHAHGDHLGSAISLAKKYNSTIVAVNELANYVTEKGCKAHNMHIGGSYMFPFGKVKFTIAHHGSSSPEGLYMGEAAGILISSNNKTLYHAGDTGLFLDMKLIGELNKINVALLPIGDNFTMGIDDAIIAAEFLNPDIVIPMHYNTFPVISQNPQEFLEKIKKKNINARILNFGETIEI